ncbi:MAG: hypothetical protein ABIZ09_05495, partial [Rhodoferax sp.]
MFHSVAVHSLAGRFARGVSHITLDTGCGGAASFTDPPPQLTEYLATRCRAHAIVTPKAQSGASTIQ